MKATEYFDINMSSNEARLVFFTKYKEANSPQELEELTAAYSAIAKAIMLRDMEKAMIHNQMC